MANSDTRKLEKKSIEKSVLEDIVIELEDGTKIPLKGTELANVARKRGDVLDLRQRTAEGAINSDRHNTEAIFALHDYTKMVEKAVKSKLEKEIKKPGFFRKFGYYAAMFTLMMGATATVAIVSKDYIKEEMDQREKYLMNNIESKAKTTAQSILKDEKLWEEAQNIGTKVLNKQLSDYLANRENYAKSELEKYKEALLKEAVQDFKKRFEKDYGKPLTKYQIKEIFNEVYENRILPDIKKATSFENLFNKKSNND